MTTHSACEDDRAASAVGARAALLHQSDVGVAPPVEPEPQQRHRPPAHARRQERHGRRDGEQQQQLAQELAQRQRPQQRPSAATTGSRSARGRPRSRSVITPLTHCIRLNRFLFGTSYNTHLWIFRRFAQFSSSKPGAYLIYCWKNLLFS